MNNEPLRILPLAAVLTAALVAGCSVKPTTVPQEPAQSAPLPAAASAPEAKPVEPPVVAQGEPAPSSPAAPSAEGKGAESKPAKAPAKAAIPSPQQAPKKEVAPEPAKKEAAQEPAKKPEPPLDLASLETRLKETKAIGLMTKIALKNQVDDLLNQFRGFYAGKVKTTLAELRRAYDLLVLKVLSLLQDSDPSLAAAIVASREAIWGILSDRVKFSNFSSS
jgi:hypothetical protein